MTHSPLDQSRKRKLLGLLALLPWGAGCSKTERGDLAADPQHRFTGVRLVLVVDAVAGAQMEGVVMYDDLGWKIYSSAVVARRNRSIMAVGSGRVPLSVHLTWRDNPRPIWGKNGGIDWEGEIAGNYTVPVAKRIPDTVLRDIRARGGNLRLKFRLKADGVLFGWDIERAASLGDVSIFEMPGGDFLETRY
ncbi:hypothetical protein GCM10027320_05440 [Massilia solisilvae]